MKSDSIFMEQNTNCLAISLKSSENDLFILTSVTTYTAEMLKDTTQSCLTKFLLFSMMIHQGILMKLEAEGLSPKLQGFIKATRHYAVFQEVHSHNFSLMATHSRQHCPVSS
mmetsp:Transcript_940/g.1485  ORF Transcript_940/g.1485 Transcript_940/m.1485 type:complete len:112 (+) Transcript_940:11-346(+)